MVYILVLQAVILGQTTDDQSIRDRFSKEYPAAVAELESRFSKYQGVARLQQGILKGDKVQGAPVRFARNGLLQKFEFSADADDGNKSRSFDYVYCSAGMSSFELTRPKSKEARYKISKLGSNPVQQNTYRSIFGKFLDSPYAIYGTSLSRMMVGKDFRIKEAREISRDGDTLVELDFEFGTFNKAPNFYRVRLNPSLNWAIVYSEFRPGSSLKNPEILSVDYSARTEQSYFFPKKIFAHSLDGSTETCVLDKFEPATVPEAQFGLEYYGLKDVTKATANTSIWVNKWILGASAVVAMFCIATALRNRVRSMDRSDQIKYKMG